MADKKDDDEAKKKAKRRRRRKLNMLLAGYMIAQEVESQ